MEWLRYADMETISIKDKNEFTLVIALHCWAGGTYIFKEYGSDTLCIENTTNIWHRYNTVYMGLDTAAKEEFAKRLDVCCRREDVYHRLTVTEYGMNILVGHVYDIGVIDDLDGPVERIGRVVDTVKKVQRLVDRVLGPIALPGSTSVARKMLKSMEEVEELRGGYT